MLSNIASVFTKEGVLFQLIVLFMSWLSPALELMYLLYFLTVLDWILDVAGYFRTGREKGDLWPKITQPVISKLIYYSVFAIALHATQAHLFKDSISLYKILMVVPISAELLSIAKTVEVNTGIKVVSRIVDIFDS